MLVGGQFNPIIPRLDTVPAWWERHGHRFETAEQIVNGYLDFFEPDLLVEAEPRLADGLGFDPERVFALSGLLPRKEQPERNGQGQSVFSLYRDLYRKELQFARRHEHDIADVVPEDASLTGATACIFGAFPEDNDLLYFRRPQCPPVGTKSPAGSGRPIPCVRRPESLPVTPGIIISVMLSRAA